MGWIGTNNQLQQVLRSFRADQDTDGAFLFGPDDHALCMFMGDPNGDVVVAEDACYYVNGQPRDLNSAIAATSYGTRVTVI